MSDSEFNQNKTVEVPLHFKCPISQTLLIDPIIVPCCGRAYSRMSLQSWFDIKQSCPMCQQNLNHFNLRDATKARSLQDAIDAFIKQHNGNIDELNSDLKIDRVPKWKACVKRVLQSGPHLTKIGQLTIENINKDFNFKTLLITCVDESGSMSGNPIDQVKFSLKRIIDSAYDYPNVLCQVVGYDNTAQSFFVDTSLTKENNYNRVDKIGRCGGTTFQSAFDKISEIMINMKDNPVHDLSEISNLIVIFMTDGQDSTYGDERMRMVDRLSQNIKSVWNKPFTVHTVGFGTGHDFVFLQKLALAGTQEGAYKFADPNENNDSLSVKIMAIIRTIMNNGSAPIKISVPNISNNNTDDIDSFRIIGGENGKYWIDITKYDEDSNQKYGYNVSLKGVPDQNVLVHFDQENINNNNNNNNNLTIENIETNDKDNEKIEYSYYSYLLDKIAEELYNLNNEKNLSKGNEIEKLPYQTHLEIISQRIKALSLRLKTTSDEYRRLTSLSDTLNELRKGNKVDQMKLADQKSEGLYKSVGGSNNNNNNNQQITCSQYVPSNYQTPIYLPSKKVDWPIHYISDYKRIYQYTHSDIDIFRSSAYFMCSIWLKARSSDQILNLNLCDSQDSNLLIMMCALGRIRVVEDLLKMNVFDPNTKNKLNQNALDVAVLFGHWKTYDLLKKYTNIELSWDPYQLFRTCIHYQFYNTAERLVRSKKVIIDEDMISSCPPRSTQWLVDHSDNDIDIETAILKGVYDIVEEKIKNGETQLLDWKKFDHILNKPKVEHVQIFDLLLKNKLLIADQVYEISNPTIDLKEGDDTTELTWPLFVASEKGNMTLFNVLMKYVSKESIHRQNKKGGYCLWIASCNKHIDIVSRLLSEGADPNMVNIKGENSIVPACQKSAVSIVELLLVAGAKLDLYNRERDNPYLLCCRTGQSVILEMFLQRLNVKELEDIHNQYAQVDGFNPLHASTEIDKLDCIKVCYKYRANLEWKTMKDNKIIPGATALHLACFYNRLDSLKVLIEIGADPLATTDVGYYNCLHIAVRRGHLRIVGHLMSLPCKDQLINQKDNEGRVPGYYAQISGNEEIYQEYFCNKLTHYMEKLIGAPEKIVIECIDKMIKFGQSPGIYEYNNFVNLEMNRGMNIASLGILNRSDYLTNSLLQMGADFFKKDEFGVTADFWRTFITDNITDQTSDDTKQMILRVQQIQNKSFQNKVLLTIPNNSSNISNIQSSILNNNVSSNLNLNPMLKMNDGYNKNVDQSVLKLLKRSECLDQSILGFIDKLKSGKHFPDGKDCLEYIQWDSKIHMIRLIASDEKYLNPVQILALYLYSTNKTIFEQVNNTLTKWNESSIWLPFIFTIYQAINMLPKYENEVYRAINSTFNDEFYKLGSELTWSTFSICSKESSACIDMIKQNKGIVFIVKSKSGRLISRYSKNPADQDVIFLPESKFTVTNYYQANQMVITQENIRNTTFKIKDKDIQNAINGQCIIVELVEC